jgi:hypothetical protein
MAVTAIVNHRKENINGHLQKMSTVALGTASVTVFMALFIFKRQ